MIKVYQYGVGETSLGKILVMTVNDKICELEFLTSTFPEDHLINKKFTGGRVINAAEAVSVIGLQKDILQEAVRFIEAPKTTLEVPLEMIGTPFQISVWNTLRKIPVGETRSYQEVAASLGLPKGARAVANACAANTIAVAIPCHRVIASTGALSGYAWGVERKQALLDREKL